MIVAWPHASWTDRMLVEQRQCEKGKVAILGPGEGLWQFKPFSGSGGDRNEWRFGSYGTAGPAEDAMKTGTPNAGCLEAYETARAATNTDLEAYRIRSIRRKRVFDDTGDEPDVDRWMSGDSRCWGAMKKAAKNRCITVGLMLWMSCGNGDSDFAENVAQGVALADSLQSAGYMVRVVGVHAAAMSDGYRGFTHPLVEFGQPIDEHGLMAWGQPAACRHLGFAWMEGLYGNGEMGWADKTPDEWLTLAGIDIFLARQWTGDEQKQHLAKVLEKIQNQE